MGGGRIPEDSFDGACRVAGKGNLDDLGWASESKWKLRGSQANRGEERGFSEAVQSSRIFLPADG